MRDLWLFARGVGEWSVGVGVGWGPATPTTGGTGACYADSPPPPPPEGVASAPSPRAQKAHGTTWAPDGPAGPWRRPFCGGWGVAVSRSFAAHDPPMGGRVFNSAGGAQYSPCG